MLTQPIYTTRLSKIKQLIAYILEDIFNE